MIIKINKSNLELKIQTFCSNQMFHIMAWVISQVTLMTGSKLSLQILHESLKIKGVELDKKFGHIVSKFLSQIYSGGKNSL